MMRIKVGEHPEPTHTYDNSIDPALVVFMVYTVGGNVDKEVLISSIYTDA